MAIHPVLLVPHPTLKRISAPVEAVDQALRDFMDDMAETLEAEEGAGLAAVQVGVLKRVIVIDLRPCSESRKAPYLDDPNFNRLLHLVNPVITWESAERITAPEACLSVPGGAVEVSRAAELKLDYLDYDGQPCALHARGLLAICVQHEMDHLNGITLLDHASFVKKDAILRKVKKYAAGT